MQFVKMLSKSKINKCDWGAIWIENMHGLNDKVRSTKINWYAELLMTE